jgi:aspartate racemase
LVHRPELQTTYVAPENHLQGHLIDLWQEFLGFEPIGIRHDFFEIGGDSLRALSLFAELEERLGELPPLGALLSCPTIEQIAAKIVQKSYESDLAMRFGDGTSSPLFCVPGARGLALHYRPLVNRLRCNRPIYGLHYPGIDGRTPPRERVEELVRQLVAKVRELEPNGPYYLVGNSFGGLVAYEMAQQLTAAKETVSLLVLIDARPPSMLEEKASSITGRLQRLRRRLYILAQELSRRGPRDGARWMLHRVRGRILRPKAEEQGNIPPHLAVSLAMQRVMQACYNARWHYRMRPYTGRVLLLLADTPSTRPWRHLQFYGQDRYRGWGKWLRGTVEVESVPGPHGTVIDEPNAGAVAEKLQVYLNTTA